MTAIQEIAVTRRHPPSPAVTLDRRHPSQSPSPSPSPNPDDESQVGQGFQKKGDGDDGDDGDFAYCSKSPQFKNGDRVKKRGKAGWVGEVKAVEGEIVVVH